jgi:hypothetical protein
MGRIIKTPRKTRIKVVRTNRFDFTVISIDEILDLTTVLGKGIRKGLLPNSGNALGQIHFSIPPAGERLSARLREELGQSRKKRMG